MDSALHHFSYAFRSNLQSQNAKTDLHLCAVRSNENATYFSGELLNPALTARCLGQLALLVSTRFYTTPAMLARILRESDPVVTVSDSMLRFEGFSACCSAYARLDVLPESINAKKMVSGTTNVDFNAEMRSLLCSFRRSDAMFLSVKPDDVTVSNGDKSVVEKKVVLPKRWIKGFSEVQSIQTGMTEAFKIPKQEAIRFFRQLPKGKTKHPVWIVPAGKGIRVAHRAVAGSVCVNGLERLALLSKLMTDASELVIYSDEKSSSSAWTVCLPGHRFTLVLSDDIWRGFSGEGQILKSLSEARKAKYLNEIRATLKWQSEIDTQTHADMLQISHDNFISGLNILAASGLVGFDLYKNVWFHRVLPFELSQSEKMNPRFKAAENLLQQDKLEVSSKQPGDVQVDVRSNDIVHQVRGTIDNLRCSCPWYAKHKLERGPCKHILATLMLLEEK